MKSIALCLSTLLISQCALAESNTKTTIYQMLPRVFANENTTNKEWGSIAENGSGKLAHIDSKALAQIKADGATHVWYTGVLHHALTNDYQRYGINSDDPEVIKGRAGSPYAIKDYYNINPDLAVDVNKRKEEFKALVERTHQADLKVIIDIVPNHVARNYKSTSAPEGITDFGAEDNTALSYARDNNFYYNPGEAFKLPNWLNGYQPMGGISDPRVDGQYAENPARWTGNGSRASQPHFNDWYETIKVNFGVRPDGRYDFPKLSDETAAKGCAAINEFWAQHKVPSSWLKFEEIAHYWLEFGVDGFRFDMAEMVPVEFWSYLNCSINAANPEAFLLAEFYQPHLYRDYLHKGKMSALYDKVGFYDSLKAVMQERGSVSDVIKQYNSVADIQSQMLHFLENHDEQRLAHPEFAGNALMGRPAMAVSMLISKSPSLVYFGQSLGETATEDAGFGTASRTTIFDYWGLASIKRWRNDGAYDCGSCSDSEKSLNSFYQELQQLALHPIFMGETIDLHALNLAKGQNYTEQQWSFIRKDKDTQVLVVANFAKTATNMTLQLPDAINSTGLTKLLGESDARLKDKRIELHIGPMNVMVIEL